MERTLRKVPMKIPSNAKINTGKKCQTKICIAEKFAQVNCKPSAASAMTDSVINKPLQPKASGAARSTLQQLLMVGRKIKKEIK